VIWLTVDLLDSLQRYFSSSKLLRNIKIDSQGFSVRLGSLARKAAALLADVRLWHQLDGRVEGFGNLLDLPNLYHRAFDATRLFRTASFCFAPSKPNPDMAFRS